MSVIKKIDRVAEISKAMASLTKGYVLVGIPDDAGNEDGIQISFAQLGYIQDAGSPLKNIPPRPFLLPGIEAAKDGIAEAFRKGFEAALKGSKSGVRNALERAGSIASQSVKAKINNGPFTPLAPATIEARADRGRKGAKQYLKLKAEGVPEDVLNDAALVKPLVDTGALRNSVTYVVRD